MNARATAKRYFEFSNDSDFDQIADLFADQASYSSQNTGKYLGRDSIIAMQKEFHGKFKTKRWDINNSKEFKTGLVLVDYDFTGEMLDGKKVQSSGFEYISVKNGRIISIEIKNK